MQLRFLNDIPKKEGQERIHFVIGFGLILLEWKR